VDSSWSTSCRCVALMFLIIHDDVAHYTALLQKYSYCFPSCCVSVGVGM
jgi:hypothetical protein